MALAESFRPTFDMAQLPRMTAMIYKTEDEMQPECPYGHTLENP